MGIKKFKHKQSVGADQCVCPQIDKPKYLKPKFQSLYPTNLNQKYPINPAINEANKIPTFA